ncbi:hypothetical protein NN561_011653 [Cricetulus griseus]
MSQEVGTPPGEAWSDDVITARSRRPKFSVYFRPPTLGGPAEAEVDSVCRELCTEHCTELGLSLMFSFRRLRNVLFCASPPRSPYFLPRWRYFAFSFPDWSRDGGHISSLPFLERSRSRVFRLKTNNDVEM